MQFVFGPGNLAITPLTDAYGGSLNNGTSTVPTPRILGAFQEATFDTSAENKMLYGPNQFPLAVGRGKGKAGLKVKAAQFSIDQWNSAFIGQPANQTAGVLAAYVDNVGTVVPVSPFQILPFTTYAGYLIGSTPQFDADFGVRDGSGNAFTRIYSGTPVTYQYLLTIAGGIPTYLFSTADHTAGVTVFISFSYTATAASGAQNKYVIVNNIQMGLAPFLRLDLYCTYGGNPLLVTLYQAIASKLSFATKLDDFSVPDMEFDGFSNNLNQIYRIGAGQ